MQRVEQNQTMKHVLSFVARISQSIVFDDSSRSLNAAAWTARQFVSGHYFKKREPASPVLIRLNRQTCHRPRSRLQSCGGACRISAPTNRHWSFIPSRTWKSFIPEIVVSMDCAVVVPGFICEALHCERSTMMGMLVLEGKPTFLPAAM
jgi:hypothetical protein